MFLPEPAQCARASTSPCAQLFLRFPQTPGYAKLIPVFTFCPRPLRVLVHPWVQAKHVPCDKTVGGITAHTPYLPPLPFAVEQQCSGADCAREGESEQDQVQVVTSHRSGVSKRSYRYYTERDPSTAEIGPTNCVRNFVKSGRFGMGLRTLNFE